ncbi:MAG: hypothetical protein SGBAC_002320 [Bacillariaceae sp.]
MVECLRSVFPLAVIETIREDRFPLEVKIVASTPIVKAIPLWSGKQHNLFEKYRVRRRKTMKAIIKNLNRFKENLEISREALSDQPTLSPDHDSITAVKIPSPTLVSIETP